MSLEYLKITEAKIVETTEQVMRGTHVQLVCENVNEHPISLGKSLLGNRPQTRTEIIETVERDPTLQELREAMWQDEGTERMLQSLPVSNEQKPKEVLRNALAGAGLGWLLALGPSLNQEMVVPGTASGAFIGATAVALLMRKLHIHSSPSTEELLNERDILAEKAAPSLARLAIIRNAIADVETRQAASAPE